MRILLNQNKSNHKDKMEIEGEYVLNSINDCSDVKIIEKVNDQVDSLPWVEKYRPSELDQVISQNDIICTCFLLYCCF